MLDLKVGDSVKTKLVHHICDMCEHSAKSRSPYYMTWRVKEITKAYIKLVHKYEPGGRMIAIYAPFEITGRGLGSLKNHVIYKVNGEYCTCRIER
jgi:hypothetical protein